MFNYSPKEALLDQNENKLKRLTIEFEQLNRNIDAFFKEYGVTNENMGKLIANHNQFSEEEWHQLNEERLKLEEKLKTQLSQVRDPQAAKKRYEERNVAPHWLFVR